jgi:lysozyme
MNIEELRKSLIKHEAMKLKPYRCTADKLTIGVGRNLEDVGISVDEADFMLDNDIKRCMADLDRTVPTWKTHNDIRQNVLIELVFNLGITGALRFKKMLAALQKNDYASAAVEMLDSKWAKQVGQRSATMAQMMREGK